MEKYLYNQSLTVGTCVEEKSNCNFLQYLSRIIQNLPGVCTSMKCRFQTTDSAPMQFVL